MMAVKQKFEISTVAHSLIPPTTEIIKQYWYNYFFGRLTNVATLIGKEIQNFNKTV